VCRALNSLAKEMSGESHPGDFEAAFFGGALYNIPTAMWCNRCYQAVFEGFYGQLSVNLSPQTSSQKDPSGCVELGVV
jgi:hypothetical protein